MQDFYGDHNPEVFLDWIHSMDAFFGWYDILERRKFQLAEAKLKGTTRMCDNGGYEVLNTWEEMKIAIKKRFQPLDYQ